MHVRVVRFDEVDPERVAQLADRISESDGPPPGVEATGTTLLHDPAQRTVVVLQRFASAQTMASSEAVLDGIDSSETPGRRLSVDRCEVLVDLDV